MSTPRPKHVIWITTDHMRFDCIGAHGNPGMVTPNLDTLVGGGVSFAHCYAQNPLCMPSRCSFMTGLYPAQSQVTENGHTLDPDCPTTVARCFKQAGYQTAQIGKLHFQPHEDNDLDPRARHDYGFDIFWLSEEPGCYEDAYMTWLRTRHPELVETFRVPRSASFERGGQEGPRVLDAPWQASYSGWVADQFDRYMGTWGGRHQPQFIHLGFYAPHPPLNPTREMFAPYENRELPDRHFRDGEEADKPEPLAGMMRGNAPGWDGERFAAYRRHFYAMVTGVDLALGQVIDRLKALGVYEDTLIVFGSDHGDMCGDHSMVAKQPSFFEEVMRLPLLLHWPKGLGSGSRRIDGLVEMVDVLPTLLGLAGQPVPPSMAGRDWSSALLADQPIGRVDVFAWHGPGQLMLREADWKYLRYPGENGPGEVLYDLRNDPDEYVNAIGSADRALVDRLRQRAFDRALAASASPQQRVFRF